MNPIHCLRHYVILNPLAARTTAVLCLLSLLLLCVGAPLYAVVGLLVLTAGSAYAQTATGLETKISDVTDTLTTVGRPIAGLALVVVFLTYIAEPILPDMARENKGKIQKVALGAVLLGIAPDIVDFLFV